MMFSNLTSLKVNLALYMGPQTILITGANGFIGSHLVKRLLREDCRILALTQTLNNETVKNEKLSYVAGNLLHWHTFEHIPDCQTVFHLSGTLDHSKGTQNLMNMNFHGTQNILEFCKQRRIKKLIFLSTVAVMAEGRPLMDLSEKDLTPSKQIGAYATSKALAEKVLLEYEGNDLEICVVRSPFVWGTGDRYSLPKIIDTINKKMFSWIDNGNYPFATCHVENLAEGLYKAYLNGKNKEVYYIQDKELTTIREFLSDLIRTQGLQVPRRNASRRMVEIVCGLIELPWKILPLKSEPPTHLREALALMGVPITIGSNKAEKDINYLPVIDRETGMREMKLSDHLPSRASRLGS